MQDHAPRAVIVLSPADDQRPRLHASVRDLATYLEKISGARTDILHERPAGDVRVPILVGETAIAEFGPTGEKTRFRQAWRLVVGPAGVGLLGESEESTSYAVYELLHRLGCRWYMPSEMGEVYPSMPTISLDFTDIISAPGTDSRDVWYADDDFRRRNRLGGMTIQAGHALEMIISKKQREEHPEWRATIGGKPHPHRLKWTHPEVAPALADAINARLDKHAVPSVSISPDDGVDFDDAEDTQWDAGDWDDTTGTVSITDRYLHFSNLIADRVAARHPDVLLGFLAYGNYMRLPLRETPRPNLVPEIAPITYCRAHAMTDSGCPSRQSLRPIVEGWGSRSKRLAYYHYMFHLAEVTVPYPMIHQLAEELPILFRSGVRHWQPETIPNFESVLPGMVLSLRKAWNPAEDSALILEEFYTRFYGAAAGPMREYWTLWDNAWTQVPEHAGSLFGHTRRFPPDFMKQARTIMNHALAAARTAMEYRRVRIQDDALRQFEAFMRMRWDLNDGRLAGLAEQADRWKSRQRDLGDDHAAQFAFTRVRWTPHTIGGNYFRQFVEATYRDAARIAATMQVVGRPVRSWRFSVDRDDRGEVSSWFRSDFDDAGWVTTDVGVDTWDRLGAGSHLGAAWYRHTLPLPVTPTGKKIYLWVSSADGALQAWVNGQPVRVVSAKGEGATTFEGYCQPVSFDVTDAVVPGQSNQVTLKTTRKSVNELGAGGLLGPVLVYREK